MENIKTVGEPAGGKKWEGDSKGEGVKNRKGMMLRGKVKVAEQNTESTLIGDWEHLGENLDVRPGRIGWVRKIILEAGKN